ncbi:MAG: PTS sugar transporter subunit IIB [Holdemania filiformis]
MNEYLQSSGIVDVRVDDRMVHGIVATMWIPENHCTRVMVVNEDASNNQVIRSTLKMSVPAGVSLSVWLRKSRGQHQKWQLCRSARVYCRPRDSGCLRLI